MSKAEDWSCDEVGNWLQENGFTQYRQLFCVEHKIDGLALLSLVEEDLKQPPLNIRILGDVKRLIIKINAMKGENPEHMNPLTTSNGSVFHRPRVVYLSPRSRYLARRSLSVDSAESDDIDEEISYSYGSSYAKNLDPEIWKTALSFIYVFAVFLLTAFVMVIVHDRVPDMQKYPPLPDLFLDNMPYVPWAFEACELVGTFLCTVWIIILLFHKHRFILMRRMFSLTGTIFLLRCVTMLITSLSVPGVHLQCSGQRYGDMWTRLTRTFEIWKKFGMSLQGVSSCGDYMFSGHTAIITIFNFFITEYTPRNRLYYLHMMSWVLNFFGIFFILSAHEHYSIDVFISFYLTSRLFMYYHTLANNRSLRQTDAPRTRIWFPMFSFFESKCDGIVPNKFEWPLIWPRCIVEYFEPTDHEKAKKN
ncbi:sphingomyelin synthase-related protein 1-like isoform X2 [Gigantopelta aegis]|uniref:sphingomyelin synthase-related protein 1-like isoform X2 n=1 Tax=Gigantopelta aegis TaxID=1735272 RepID=UPI001B88D20F|nr:sphingomyelin synthase-related protein 1-like isoform X2 [Gigantopelta aegis]